MSNMRVENWCGHDIRFVEVNGEWMAILKDICDALRLRTFKVSQRLHPDMMDRVPIEVERSSVRPTKYSENFHDIPSKGVVKSVSTVYMLVVNELGIYEALFASRRLEARKFRMWAGGVLQKLRHDIGLKQYEVMRMTEPDIQRDIDHMLSRIYYDDELEMLMESRTVVGGDVEQYPFYDEDVPRWKKLTGETVDWRN